jgi:hypothetical protein
VFALYLDLSAGCDSVLLFEILYFKCIPVEFTIREMTHPVAKDYTGGIIGYFQVGGNMPVPENEVIGFRFLSCHLAGKYKQDLFVVKEIIFVGILLYGFRNAAAARKIQAHFCAQIRMQPAKQELIES